MCTDRIERIAVAGSAKGARGWVTLAEARISVDHPFQAPGEEAVLIDFVERPDATDRVAVELTPASARAVIRAVGEMLERAEHPLTAAGKA